MITRTYATRTAIAEITDSQIKDMLSGIDMESNQVMINALMHGTRIKNYTRVQGTNLSEGYKLGL